MSFSIARRMLIVKDHSNKYAHPLLISFVSLITLLSFHNTNLITNITSISTCYPRSTHQGKASRVILSYVILRDPA